MGRAPCCDKSNVKKGPWSPEEDTKLKSYIDEHGTGGNWIALPQKIGLKRCGKSCRLRWLNYLRPNLKHGGFTEEEDNIICSLYITIGSRWSIIASQLPGRTDNDIKNYWNTRLKKKLLGKHRKEQSRSRACLTQEVKRESENNNYMNPNYWPLLPHMIMPPSNVNLGTFQYPSDANLSQDQVYANSMLGTPMASQFSNTNTHVSEAGGANMNFLGLEDFPVELSELLYGTCTEQQRQIFESFYGMDQLMNVSSSTGTSSTESSITWGDINGNNRVYSPKLVSNYEARQQSAMPEVDHNVCSFQESKYNILDQNN
ncbi:hypothetical protein ACFE04_000718 [Oxalis oulophora]